MVDTLFKTTVGNLSNLSKMIDEFPTSTQEKIETGYGLSKLFC